MKYITNNEQLEQFEKDRAIQLLTDEISNRANELYRERHITIEDNLKWLKRIDKSNLIKAFQYFLTTHNTAIYIDRDEETFDIISVNLDTNKLFPTELITNLDLMYGYYKQNHLPIYEQSHIMGLKVKEGDYLYFTHDGELLNRETFLEPDIICQVVNLTDYDFNLKQIKTKSWFQLL